MKIAFWKSAKSGKNYLIINGNGSVKLFLEEGERFKPYGKNVTEGERNAHDRFRKALEKMGLRNSIPFNSYTRRDHKIDCSSYIFDGVQFFSTDVAQIKGISTGQDGLFIHYNEHLISQDGFNRLMEEK